MPSRRQSSARQSAHALQLWMLASHELRQPIVSLALLAAALRANCSPSQRRAIADRIELVTRSLEMMLNHLDRLTAPAVEPAIHAAALLSSTLGAAIDELRPSAEQAGIRLDTAGTDRPEAAIKVPVQEALLAEILKAMLLYPIKLGSGHTIDVAVRRRGRHIFVDVGFDGPDPTGAMQRQAFVELVAQDGKPDSLVQGLGLSLAAAISRHLDLVLSAGKSRGDRQRLTLRFGASPTTRAYERS